MGPGAFQVKGVGRRDVVRSHGVGVDDSAYISIAQGAFLDAMLLPNVPVLDAGILDAKVIKVGRTQATKVLR
jgi:hypothetical protein